MGAVELVPSEVCSRGREGGVDFGATFAGNVRVLAAPDHHELAFNVRNSGEGVVGLAFPEAALVDIGGVETSGGGDPGNHGRAEREVAAETDAHGADATAAAGVSLEQ